MDETPGPPGTTPPGTSRTAAFFDLDKTVIATSSALAFGRRFYRDGLINRRTVLRSSYAQFVYLLAGADTDQQDKMRDYLKNMVAGWDVAQIQSIVTEALHDLIDPLIYDEAASLIEEHRVADRDVVIVSSSGTEVVEPIAAMVGAGRVIATRLAVSDGRYTGEIEFYASGEFKATAIRELAQRQGYDLARCWAYSDSVADVPMLETVGHPYAVNPDRGLRRVATERDWPILRFAHPVRLRSRLPSIPTPPRPALTSAAVAAAGAAGIVSWYAGRRLLRR